jgi:putative nucleotidyltransferase with HDIG domain
MSNKRRILFVDDEPNVLQGLERMLRCMRHEWDMVFAGSAQDALSILSREPMDVVVTDMRMPGMDGAELLNHVMKQYPHIVRIILSGQSDREIIMKSIGPTHQFLSKPCGAEKIKATIARAFALHDVLADEELKELVSNMKSLPSLPSLYLELMQELQSPDFTMRRVGEIISKDVGMTAKILQLVNSAFFGLRTHVSDPIHAAKLLGADIIKALVLSVQIFSKFDQNKLKSISLKNLLDHSLSVASFAKEIAIHENQNQKITDNALIAGMLHDTGKLVLADNFPEQYSRTFALANNRGIPIWEAELKTIGSTHADVGAYLLGLWGLPDDIVEAVAFHHFTIKSPDNSFTPLAAVHVANILDHEIRGEDNYITEASIDLDLLDELGLTDRLPIWRQICREAKQRGT